ncbi:SIMPL domain-containing protein [Ferrimonas balearica]|uniref:SIMPL domain-containing protein n=1 Tax=Ferrimonas balearica TaxID=44012 RepID=UPI001C5A6D74|nr:SIMPL domain-containing protein [Ferrimonas balearica]MBW3166572.1 SIMPL domain-containing protein [Ferrimonas balearica]
MRNILFSLLLLPGLALAQPRWIEVDGVGSADVAPSRATLSAQITALADTPQQAQTEADKVMNRVLSAFDDAGIESARYGAGSLTLGPRYDYRERERVLLGYEARRGVTLDVPVEQVGQWLGRFTELGLTEIGNPVYGVADDVELRRTLLRLALEDGLDKAQVLADRLDGSLGDVLEITEQGGTPVLRNRMMAADASEAGRYQLAQQAQEVRLRIKVELN